jgi:FKBP-type peptidyl-prolyl cis-trans isomerase
MKKNLMALIIAGIVVLAIGYLLGSFVPVKGLSGGSLKMKTDLDSFAVAFGLDFGNYINQTMEQMKLTEEFPDDLFFNSASGAYKGKESPIESNEASGIVQAFFMKRSQEVEALAQEKGFENIEKGKDFLKANKAKPGVQETESGLQYIVLTEGTGAKPSDESEVVVHYKGTLIDGTVFDSSYDRGEPATFPVNAVIPGWTEALKLMKEGAKYQLFIPSELAYGPQQAGNLIEPNSTLIFEVELIEVK